MRLLQAFSEQNRLNIHLDCRVLGGGGYETMLKRALQYQARDKKLKNKPQTSILLLDGDRDQRKEDGWTLEKLKREAKKIGFRVCVQQPNQEGLIFRMLPGNEGKRPNVKSVNKLLAKQWPAYEKPIDFRMLSQKFTLNDLLRVAKVDEDLRKLLSMIGY